MSCIERILAGLFELALVKISFLAGGTLLSIAVLIFIG